MAPILVAGGGPGGLAVAHACRRIGRDVVVLERSDALRAAGAGLTVQVNAMRALQTLELADAVAAAGAPLRRGLLWDRHGRQLQAMSLEGSLDTWGLLSIAIARPALAQVMVRDLPDGTVRFGAGVTGVRQDADGVDVTLEDGTTVRGDVLVGADGLHSAVRTAVFGPFTPRYAGYTCWRGLAPVDTGLPDGHTVEVWGRGRRFGIVPVAADQTYWFAALNAPAGGEDAGDRAAAVLDAFGHLGPAVRRVVEATPAEDMLRNDIVDLLPLPAWSQGRVTLLGDAAHATTPNMGQGACLAIEDAVVLAAHLARTDDVSAALRAYEAERRPRATAVQRQSWQIGAVGQWSNPVACWVRDRLASLTPPSVAARQVQALHGVALPSLAPPSPR
ncbi:MAG: FAD-dependent monooxygenase [Alphaproteobacteria bacterium]|nr:FAD-dependent monooxygenase [Alphaproteobacteria bacterium]